MTLSTRIFVYLTCLMVFLADPIVRACAPDPTPVPSFTATITPTATPTPSGFYASGASITESSPVALTLWVDPVSGLDSNPGTSGSPYQTWGKALTTAALSGNIGGGTKIWLNDGTYPETLSLAAWSGLSATGNLIIQAVHTGMAKLDGADNWSGHTWTNSGGVWSATWPNSWGYTNPAPFAGSSPALPVSCASLPAQTGCVFLRRELVFVKNPLDVAYTRLDQITSGTPVAGQYLVTDGSTIKFVPPAGITMPGADIMVGIRQNLFSAPNGIRNMVVSGIKFIHDTNAINGNGNGAFQITDNNATSNSGNVLINNCNFDDNNWVGLSFHGRHGTYNLTAGTVATFNPISNVTVQNSTSNGNGEDGSTFYLMSNVRVTEFTATGNNWRGNLAGQYGWDIAAGKWLDIHTGTLYHGHFNDNFSHGLWYDYDNTHWQVLYSEFKNNAGQKSVGTTTYKGGNGLYLEKNWDFQIKGNALCNNLKPAIVISGTEDVALINNNIQNTRSGGYPPLLWGGSNVDNPFCNQPNPPDNCVLDWAANGWHVLYSRGWTMSGNKIGSVTSGQTLFDLSYLTLTAHYFTNSVVANNNTWWTNAGSGATAWLAPTTNTFTQWKTLLGRGQEASSTYAGTDPGVACVVVEP